MSRGAVHNALPSSPLAGALSRMLGDTTGQLGLERYGETLTPIIDPWALPEHAYLRRERLCFAYANAGAVAGEYAYISLLNPTGSGRILVLDHAMGLVGTAGSVYVCFPFADTAVVGAAVNTRGFRDSRWGVLNLPTGQVWAGTSAVGPTLALQAAYLNPASHAEVLPSPVVITPGVLVAFALPAVNVNMRLSFSWRERQALPGELE